MWHILMITIDIMIYVFYYVFTSLRALSGILCFVDVGRKLFFSFTCLRVCGRTLAEHDGGLDWYWCGVVEVQWAGQSR